MQLGMINGGWGGAWRKRQLTLVFVLAVALSGGVDAQPLGTLDPCTSARFAAGDGINIGVAIAFNRSLSWWSSGASNGSAAVPQAGRVCETLRELSSANETSIMVAPFKLEVDKIGALRIARSSFVQATGGRNTSMPVSTAVLFRADNDGGSIRSEPRVIRSSDGVPRVLGAVLRMIEGKVKNILWSSSSCGNCDSTDTVTCSPKNVADKQADGVSSNDAACFDTETACFNSDGALADANEYRGRCRPVIRFAFGGTDKNFAPLQTQQTSLNVNLGKVANNARNNLPDIPSNPITE